MSGLAIAAPVAAIDPDAVWSAIKAQESGGNGNAVGPDTPYGNAVGSTQMLPATAQAMAQKLGVDWRPELMQGNSPDALAYQDQLGRAYFDQGLAANNGDPAAASAYYFGGPDPKLHGPKTAAYVSSVMARAQGAGSDDLPSAADVAKAYGWDGQGSGQDAQPPAATPAPGASNDGMPSPEEVSAAYGWKPAPAPPAPPAQPTGIMPAITGFMANMNRGLGIGDELAAGANTAVNALTGKTSLQNIPSDFQASLAHQRQLEGGFDTAHPHIAALARGTGNALTMAAPIGPGAEAFAAPLTVAGKQVPMLVTNALRGADLAGLTGAGYAALDAGTPQERIAAASSAATNPAVLGLGAGAGALASVGTRAAKTQAPSLDQLEAEKGALYDEVSNSGARYTPEAFQGVLDDIRQRIADATPGARFNPKLYPKTADMLEHLQTLADEGYAPTPSELDQQRRFIGQTVAGASDAGERSMGVKMKSAIDDFMHAATPEQITGASDPAAIAQTLGRARDLNTRIVKLDKLNELDQAAADRASVSGSGGNINNTTRQNVLRFKNQVGNLTPDEQAAAQRVIDGTPAANVLRKIGKTSPGNGGLMANMHLVGAELTHGASVPLGVGASIAKMLADASTTKNVQALRSLIASGGEAASEVSRQLANPQYADLQAALANDLAVQAGVIPTSANDFRRGSVTVELPNAPQYGKGVSSQ